MSIWRFFLLVLVFSFPAQFAHAIEAYTCKTTESPGKWVPQNLSVTYDPTTREAMVFDDTIQHFYGLAVPARVTANSAKKFRFNWSYMGRNSSGSAKMSFIATITLAYGAFRISAKPLHYNETFAGNGVCQKLDAKDASAMARSFQKKLADKKTKEDTRFGANNKNHRFTCAIGTPKRPPTWWPKKAEIRHDAKAGVSVKIEMADGSAPLIGAGEYQLPGNAFDSIRYSWEHTLDDALRKRFGKRSTEVIKFYLIVTKGRSTPEITAYSVPVLKGKTYRVKANCSGK